MTDAKARAIALRRDGLSYKEIRKQVQVSMSSLSLWLRDVPLTPVQQQRLSYNGRRLGATQTRRRWAEYKQAVYDAYGPPRHDPHFLFGLALYWGEGNKVGTVGMTNTDVRLLQCFTRWLTTFLVEDAVYFSAQLQHHFPERDQEIRQFWLSQLPITTLYPTTFIKPRTQRKTRNNKHPHGIISVRVAGKTGWQIRQRIQKAMDVCLPQLLQ